MTDQLNLSQGNHINYTIDDKLNVQKALDKSLREFCLGQMRACI